MRSMLRKRNKEKKTQKILEKEEKRESDGKGTEKDKETEGQ